MELLEAFGIHQGLKGGKRSDLNPERATATDSQRPCLVAVTLRNAGGRPQRVCQAVPRAATDPQRLPPAARFNWSG